MLIDYCDESPAPSGGEFPFFLEFGFLKRQATSATSLRGTLCARGRLHLSLSISRDIAIAVLSPRPDPGVRATSKLLAYNNAFLMLCDATCLATGEPNCWLPANPVFLSESTRQEAHASMERIFRMMDAINDLSIQHATAEVMHITLVGRIRYTHMEIIALTLDGELRKVIFGELPLPDSRGLSADLQVPYGIIDERYLASKRENSTQQSPGSRKLQPELMWTNLEAKDVIQPRKKNIRRSPMSDFRCAVCSATNTSQRRYIYIFLFLFPGEPLMVR